MSIRVIIHRRSRTALPINTPHVNESCENNNMRTNVSVHFKEVNDKLGKLMAVNFPPTQSHV